MQDILISPDNLVALIEQVSLAPSSLSPISILRKFMGAGQTPQRKDVILAPPVTPLIETLADPLFMGSLVYRGQRIYMDTSVYISANEGSPVVAVSSQQDKLRLQSPPPIDPIGMMLAEQLGNTLFDALEISWKVSTQEAHVLMAILDAARKREFQRFLDDEIESTDSSLPVSAVAELLERPPKGGQWLTPGFSARLKLGTPNGRDFQATLLGLSEKSIIEMSLQSIGLSDALQRTLAGLLLLEGQFFLYSAKLNEDSKTTSSAEINGVQGRTGAFLAWIAAGDEVQLFSVSASGIINLAQTMLLTPWQALDTSHAAPGPQDSDATLYNLGKPRRT